MAEEYLEKSRKPDFGNFRKVTGEHIVMEHITQEDNVVEFGAQKCEHVTRRYDIQECEHVTHGCDTQECEHATRGCDTQECEHATRGCDTQECEHATLGYGTQKCEHIIREYVELHHDETIALLKKLAVIPAPSGQEEKRAAFVCKWLHKQGATEAFIDEVGNVVYPYQCETEQKLTVVMAHMDVVCQDTEELPLKEADGYLIGPGVRDDTANLVNMLMAIKFLFSHEAEKLCDKAASALCGRRENGILFVADVGEEGLGNLKGSRQIWKDYGSRIDRWICFDLNYNVIYNRAVGSRRYRISVHSEGGHSYKDFGKENAIVRLAEVITELYQVALPQNARVTYNVGRIEGGTTVNTIAQEASMLYEFRSESEEAMQFMENFLQNTLQRYQKKGVRIEAEVLGIRPGNGRVDEKKQEKLTQRCRNIIRKYYDGDIICDAGSTDGNIPLSHGVPSVTIGTALGDGTHTRQETVEIESMKTGQKIAVELICDLISG
ncbi:M20/M25/M40 family metallo-hydrolase [Marvinbryantia formatexigens DSM 14469]|uniref:M20/M25/M40 family metallo-hydrolase n=1 Tax=Marvinbryantia formatexigens TaxID=168384 RepID=UPI0021A90FDA|nr:M20/M25/M40 family metallo-hydrolase [Marvinbryantia formatexigens]UWO26062.1 M20/M25/M40 family metallo-hydrolase [Marvinbryantia formatexigens DSM 14469]